MAKLEGNVEEIRRSSFKGQFIVYARNGQLILAKWPKKRGRNISARQAAAAEKFRQAAMATKYMTGQEVATSYDWAKQTNALPRDFLMMALYGRLGVICTIDGRRYYPVAARDQVSELLDTLGFGVGFVLFRDDEYWKGLEPRFEGDVLTLDANGKPGWAVPSGGGGAAADPAKSTLLRLASDHNTTISTWSTIAEWVATRDTLEAFDAGLPGRLTVPAGVSMVRLSAKVAWQNNSTGGRYLMCDHKQSDGTIIDRVMGDMRQSLNETVSTLISPWLSVTPGEFFQLNCNPGATSSRIESDGFGSPTWWQAEWYLA